jgi:L-iditol 2-dehydrogenase
MELAELHQRHTFRLIDAPPPSDPSPGEIQVRVSAVGICGSDVHNFSEGGVGDSPCVYPMVLGHEPAGVVSKTGTGVTGWSIGDPAILEPALYCYHCEYCLTGHHNVCANIRFLSTVGEPGFFREFVNLPAHNLLPLPGNLSAGEGTIVEPLAVVLHSLSIGKIRSGETAAVFGAGPIGLLTIAALKLSGAARIWSIEPVAERRELARHLGADAVVDPSQTDPVQQINGDTGKRGVDVTFDCATKGNTTNQCLYATRNAGRVVITGIASESFISLDANAMRRKELPILTVRRSNHDSETALKLLTEEPRRFVPILTHTRPLSDIQSSFEQLESHSGGAAKIVLTPHS